MSDSLGDEVIYAETTIVEVDSPAALARELGVSHPEAVNLVSVLKRRADNRIDGEMDHIAVMEDWWPSVWVKEYGDEPVSNRLAVREITPSGEAWHIRGGAYILEPAFTDDPTLTDAFSTFDHSDSKYDAGLGETYMPQSVVTQIIGFQR